MGCYPIKELISKALGKCNGKERRHASNHRMVYTPPTYSHRRTVAKSVNFSNNNPVYIIPPDHEPDPAEPTPVHISSKGLEIPEPKEPKRARFASEPDMSDGAHQRPTQQKHHPPHHGPVQSEPYQDHRGHNEPNHGYPGSIPPHSNPACRPPIPYYAPSPLPRWEEGARRQEFFGGEYRYYPTPIREGIYNIATDPHRLTTMFSEENPNACSIS